MQKPEGKDQAELGPVQELFDHEEALPEVLDASDSEECGESHQDSDQVDAEKLEEAEREDCEHTLLVLSVDVPGRLAAVRGVGGELGPAGAHDE